jgi:hypothetical protein
MSAALTLPYVWATVNEQAVERNRRLRPLGGLPEERWAERSTHQMG